MCNGVRSKSSRTSTNAFKVVPIILVTDALPNKAAKWRANQKIHRMYKKLNLQCATKNKKSYLQDKPRTNFEFIFITGVVLLTDLFKHTSHLHRGW